MPQPKQTFTLKDNFGTASLSKKPSSVMDQALHVARTLASVVAVGVTAYGAVKSANFGIKQFENNPKQSVSLKNDFVPQKIVNPNAPRINYHKEFSPEILKGKNTNGEDIRYCGIAYQGHHLELIASLHFMEISNDATKCGLTLQLKQVSGDLNSTFEIANQDGVDFVKKYGLLYGFIPETKTQSNGIESTIFHFDREEAVKRFLAMPDQQKPLPLESSVFSFIQTLANTKTALETRIGNTEIVDYFCGPGLIYGFTPVVGSNPNQETSTFTFAPNLNKAHEILTTLSSINSNSYIITELENTIWGTVANKYPFLKSSEQKNLVEITIKLNQIVNPSFNPNKIYADSLILIPKIDTPDFQEIAKIPKEISREDSKSLPSKLTTAHLKTLCTSKGGLDLIKSFEGLRENTYLCLAKVKTIGYGCTRRDVIAKGKITKVEAENELAKDLRKHELRVKSLIPQGTLKMLTPLQFDALVSFDFNTGALDTSSILQDLKHGNLDIAQSLCLYTKVTLDKEKIFSHGLLRRRLSEMLLYDGSSESYICQNTYASWCKSLGVNPKQTLPRTDENKFIASMIKIARSNRLHELPHYVRR